MADLKGSKTEENLKTALAGESQARVKYEFYASQAKKDGDVEWKCENCGFIFKGPNAPEICPVCGYPKAHFEIRALNYK